MWDYAAWKYFKLSPAVLAQFMLYTSNTSNTSVANPYPWFLCCGGGLSSSKRGAAFTSRIPCHNSARLFSYHVQVASIIRIAAVPDTAKITFLSPKNHSLESWYYDKFTYHFTQCHILLITIRQWGRLRERELKLSDWGREKNCGIHWPDKGSDGQIVNSHYMEMDRV